MGLFKITSSFIENITEQASRSARKRMNYNFHKTPDDTLQRMINAMEPGTYVQPHKHENPEKREAFILLKGSFAIVSFDEDGNITDHIVLSQKQGNLGVEISAKTYHMVIALENQSAVYELKDGPYNPLNDKQFAPWAPAENEVGCQDFLGKIMNDLQLKATS